MRHVLVMLAACAATPPSVAPSVSSRTPVAPSPPGPIAVPLTGCSWSYAGTFTIGGAPFRLSVDTGSSVLAVAGSACATCTASGVEHLYTPGWDATDLHHRETAAYDGGDMRWTGDEVVDVVAAGSAVAPVRLYAIASQHDFFSRGGCARSDGILGLGNSDTYSWVAALARAGLPDVFAMHKCTRDGMLWLGGYDASAFAAPPIWVPMSTEVGYRVDVHGVAIGDTRVDVTGRALVDSGGPRMLLPLPAVDAIARTLADNATFRAQLGDPARWFEHGRCKPIAISRDALDAALPALTLALDGASLAMRPTESYLSVAELRGQLVFCPALRATTGPIGIDLGDRVLYSHVVIFDRAGKRMGFAPPTPCGH